jgi:acyl carrier protein
MISGSAWRCPKENPVIDMHLEIVRFALALHLSVDPHDIGLGDRLEADLGLDPLDLVLVALRLEEIEEGEFPVARLETVATVADLVGIVRAWSTMPSSLAAEERATLVPPESTSPARTKSGMRCAVSASTSLTPLSRVAYR